MNYSFDKLVAVSGLPGLFQLVANRDNGLLLKDIQTGKTQFYSVRQHQFTPLASIGIYTDDDSVELKEVFKKIRDNEEKPPIGDLNNADSVTGYFEKILPEYDRDKVKVNDMRKVIKWFSFLTEKDLLSILDPTEEEKAAKETPAQDEAGSEENLVKKEKKPMKVPVKEEKKTKESLKKEEKKSKFS